MFTDKKYSTGGKSESGASVRDAANYLFEELSDYLSKDGVEQDIEGLGLSRYHGTMWRSLGIATADASGKTLAVDKETFLQVMLGNDPRTGLPLKDWRKEHAPGSEIILAPDADVNLLYSRASLEQKKQIRQAIRRATNNVVDVLEKEVCKIRVVETDADGNKIERHVTPNGGVAFMEFEHFEARMVQDLVDSGQQTRPDCSIHSHIAHPNVAVHNGQVYSLENSYLKNAQTLADMVYKNALYNELSETFGLQFTRELVQIPRHKKRSKESFRFKIEGFTDGQRAAHGTRSRELEKEIENWLGEQKAAKRAEYEAQGLPVPASIDNMMISPEEEKRISTAMRAGKPGMTQAQMIEAWEQEWDANGFGHDRLQQIIERGMALEPELRFEHAPPAEQIMDLLTQKRQWFTQKQFRDLYLQYHAGTGKSYKQMKDEVRAALAEHGVELRRDSAMSMTKGRELQGEDHQRVFTTKALHEAEKAALEYVIANRDRKLMASVTIEEAIAGISEWEMLKSQEMGAQVRLNAEQRRAAIAMATGQGIVTAIAGSAGTGKTFSIQAAQHCLRQFSMIGSAVSGRAAENLSQEGLGGAKAVSVAAFLKRYDTETAKGNTVEVPQILWWDETATANSDQISRILQIGARAHAVFRVICSYDFKQTQAIGPTGLLRDIVNEVGQVELTQVHRQKTAEALKVAQLARDGDLGELRGHMSQQKSFDGGDGWYSVVDSRQEQINLLTERYLKSDLPFKDKLIVGLLRRDIEDLNESIRQARLMKGEIKPGVKVECEWKDSESELVINHSYRQQRTREFSVGDRVIIKEGFKVAVGREPDGKPIKDHLLTGYAGEIIEQNPHDAYMKVRFDNGKVVAWNFAEHNAVDHFYAGTVNATQGASVGWCAAMDSNFGGGEQAKMRNLLYTALSRHKHEANFVTTQALDETFEQRYSEYGLEESTIDKVLQPEQPIVVSLQQSVQSQEREVENEKSVGITVPGVEDIKLPPPLMKTTELKLRPPSLKKERGWKR